MPRSRRAIELEPDSDEIALARAKAQNWAKTDLVQRYYSEYRALYLYYLKELGVPERRVSRTRTKRLQAPDNIGKNGS